MIMEIVSKRETQLDGIHLLGFSRNDLLAQRYHNVGRAGVVVIGEDVGHLIGSLAYECAHSWAGHSGLGELLNEHFANLEIIIVVKLRPVRQLHLVV